MLTIQYNGPERVINQAVWLPGETRQATPKQLAAWQAEHGDVFVVVGGVVADEPASGAIVIDGNAVHVFDSTEEADAAAPTKRRKATK
jgi:hypothetical protein